MAELPALDVYGGLRLDEAAALGSGCHDDLNNLAGIYFTQGRFSEAEPLYQRVLTATEKAFGPRHPNFPIALNNLARLAQVQGQNQGAQQYYVRALVAMSNSVDPDNPGFVAILENYAGYLERLGLTAEANTLRVRAGNIRSRQP